MFTKSKSYDSGSNGLGIPPAPEPTTPCLLYTSDAADE